MKNLINLKELTIIESCIENIEIDAFSHNSELKRVNLRYNGIKNFDESTFDKIDMVEIVHQFIEDGEKLISRINVPRGKYH